MINFIVLILVSIIVMQDVEVLKGLKDWIINKSWLEGKIAIPLAIVIGVIAGITLNIGVTQSILDLFGIDFVLPNYYAFLDIFSSALFISKGSNIFINTLEKFKDAKGQVNVDSVTNIINKK